MNKMLYMITMISIISLSLEGFEQKYEKIIQFESLKFHYDKIVLESQRELESIIEKINEYKSDNQNISIEISLYLNEKGKDNAEYIKSVLIDNQFEKNKIDLRPYICLFDDKGINDIFITLYRDIEQDKDNDGVYLAHDKCPNTLSGVRVDEEGCALKTMIVLLANEKANSSIEVKNQKHSIVIDKPNEYVKIDSSNEAFNEAKKISKKEMDILFGPILKMSNEQKYSLVLYFDKLGLKAKSRYLLDQTLKKLQSSSKFYCRIIGHTDTLGSYEKNKALGLKRANEVKKILVDSTIPFLKIDVASYSESNLAVQTEDEVEERLNRRVELFIQ